jgi:riboflavin transporter 2
MDDELGGTKSASSSSLLLFALCTTFGIASWLGVNGLWVELPVLVDRLPESWNLPSFYTVIISIGNLLPLAYVAWRRWRRKGAEDRPVSPRGLRNERALIMTVLLLQLLAIVLLIFTWHETVKGHRYDSHIPTHVPWY